MRNLKTIFKATTILYLIFYGEVFGFDVVFSSSEILHYEYFVVSIKCGGEFEGKEVSLALLKDGGVVPDLLGRMYIKPKNLGDELIFMYIPEYGMRDGVYEVCLLVDGEKVFTSNILVMSRCQAKLKEPLKVLTFEENISILKLVTNKVKVKYVDVANEIYDLMSRLKLNTFLILGGQTTYLKDSKNVWYSMPISNLSVLKYLKKRGIQTGAYVMSFLTLGQNKKNAFKGYEPNLVFRNGKLKKEYKYTSITSRRRIEDLINILLYLGKREDIDFLGLDFIRVGDFGGYELFYDFYDEIYSKLEDSSLPFISKPKGSFKEIEEFAKLVSKNKSLNKLFKWYQAVMVSRIIKEIKNRLKEKGINKPIVAFMLGWNAGREHGQDLFMFRDAGVDYSFYMLYEFYNDKMFEKAGNYYLRYVYNLDTNIVFGNIIDSYLNNGKEGPIKTFSSRLEKFVTFYSYFTPNGFFFHDLYRLFFGRLKPFSSKAWEQAIMNTVQSIDENSPINEKIR